MTLSMIRMLGGGTIVTYTLAVLVITLARVGHAGLLLDFTQEDYPDPRVNFTACNRPSPSWVCDPGKYLTTQQADEIDQNINGLPFIGSAKAIVVAVVPRIVLQNGSLATSALDIQAFTDYQYQNVWGEYATSTLAMVYHVSNNEAWTPSSFSLVPALCVCQIIYETQQYLAMGDMKTVIDVYMQKFIGVLSSTTPCLTPSNSLPFTIDSSGTCTWSREIIISSLEPANGLQEGGTEVVIRGQNLDLTQGDVLIGTLNCTLLTRTPTQVSCNTSALLNTAYVNLPQPVFLLLSGQVQYNTGRRFVYTKPPVPTLIDVQPRTTTISGGLQLTVSGTNLNLVSAANMSTILRGTQTGRQIKYTTECQVRDPTSMLCPTPALDIASVRSTISRRHVGSRHRAARAVGDNVNASVPVDDADASVPVEDVEMSVTFIINDESSPLQNGQPASIAPYEDPVLYQFEDDHGHSDKEFISVWPENQRTVNIEGTGLLPVLKNHTLSIQVGVGFGTVQEMASNLLVCRPPIYQPGGAFGADPDITVHVGNLQFKIGSLKYFDTVWKYHVTRSAMLSGGFIVIIIILAITAYCCGIDMNSKQGHSSRSAFKS